ncbi:MAG: peptide deformylase [Deltaproteobacteria bacterium]|nr:MAG: peptide deformylase [Deltaproteobacteria bacterium]
MAVKPIVKWPDPRLRQQTVEVTQIDDEIRELYRDLCDTMFADNGVGIAAIQIGHAARMFLIDAVVAGGAEGDPPVAFINPEIVALSDETETADEGCLSFPGIYVPVERAVRARVRAMNLEGTWFELEGEGLCARAIQHEHDHLTGKLLVDFVGPLKKQMIRRKMKRLAADEAAAASGG